MNRRVILEVGSKEYWDHIAGASLIMQYQTGIAALQSIIKILGYENDDMISRKYVFDVILKEIDLTKAQIKKVKDESNGKTDSSKTNP